MEEIHLYNFSGKGLRMQLIILDRVFTFVWFYQTCFFAQYRAKKNLKHPTLKLWGMVEIFWLWEQFEFFSLVSYCEFRICRVGENTKIYIMTTILYLHPPSKLTIWHLFGDVQHVPWGYFQISTWVDAYYMYWPHLLWHGT